MPLSAPNKRLLTAIVLIPPVAWAVLALQSWQLAVLLVPFVLTAAWEWGRLAGIGSRARSGLYLMVTGAALLLAWQLIERPGGAYPLLVGAVLWWSWRTLTLVRFGSERSGGSPTRMSVLGVGLFTLVPSWAAIVSVHADPKLGPGYVLLLLVLVWVADAGAYYTGRHWGRTPLSPRLSPGKTREGLYGGIISAAILAVGCGVLLGLTMAVLAAFVLVCALSVQFSVAGDLSESLVKRLAGAKDSGSLFPGHGGMLDRIDSLTAAAPVFALGMITLKGLTS